MAIAASLRAIASASRSLVSQIVSEPVELDEKFYSKIDLWPKWNAGRDVAFDATVVIVADNTDPAKVGTISKMLDEISKAAPHQDRIHIFGLAKYSPVPISGAPSRSSVGFSQKDRVNPLSSKRPMSEFSSWIVQHCTKQNTAVFEAVKEAKTRINSSTKPCDYSASIKKGKFGLSCSVLCDVPSAMIPQSFFLNARHYVTQFVHLTSTLSESEYDSDWLVIDPDRRPISDHVLPQSVPWCVAEFWEEIVVSARKHKQWIVINRRSSNPQNFLFAFPQ
jgi:hypothetical protein